MSKVIALKVYEPYRPSNGTEGIAFMEAWCGNCARDLPWSEGKNYDDCAPDEVCSIIGDTMACDIHSTDYPKEWVYGENGPMCSAFVRHGHRPPERCKYTIDMFDESSMNNGGGK